MRQLSVLAFQKLWNLNNPNNKLTEDGAYGPNTENAILSYSPPHTLLTSTGPVACSTLIVPFSLTPPGRRCPASPRPTANPNPIAQRDARACVGGSLCNATLSVCSYSRFSLPVLYSSNALLPVFCVVISSCAATPPSPIFAVWPQRSRRNEIS